MPFFDDSHVTDVGLQGSMGPSVGFGEMVAQSFRQQFRVDSARALDDELRNRWLDSLRLANITDAEATDPFDPYAYRAFAQHVSGQPIDAFDANQPLFGEYDPTARIKDMMDANEAIKKLNNPNIKTFEQILEEVSQMQHETEEKTTSMYERTGSSGWFSSLLGSIPGSFTLRDPVNVITAPLGAGRTVAMRIMTDMGIAGLGTAFTELTDVAPAREIVGLPERSSASNIIAATLGAGVIRGGLEGVGAGFRGLGQAADITRDIDFDLRDAQLQQMFAVNDISPSARAGSSILDDTIVTEHYNPYGPTPEGVARFKAELESVSRALNGEPSPVKELPPIPHEYIDRAVTLQTVKEQSPELYARMEVAQAKVAEIEQRRGESAVELSRVSPETLSIEELEKRNPSAKERLPFHIDPAEREAEIVRYKQKLEVAETSRQAFKESYLPMAAKERPLVASENRERKAANAEYKAAYRAVEAEAERLELAQAAQQHTQQMQAINTVGAGIASEPITGPLTHHATVEAHEARVTEADAAIPARADAVNELEVDLETNTVNIGTKTPVSLDFKVPLDEGEKSVKEILDELAEDNALEEAMKGCAI